MIFNSNGQSTTANELELTAESQSLIMEAALLENLSQEELSAFLESHQETNAAIRDEVLLEKTIVRLDKKARLSQAQKVAVFTVAKERNDPLFKKLLTVWRLERFLEAQLFRKYQNEGLRRARQAMAKPAKSSSSLVKKVANNVAKQLNGSKV